MSRTRKVPYIDIVLEEKDVSKIKDGYTVHRQIEGLKYAIKPQKLTQDEVRLAFHEQKAAEIRAKLKNKPDAKKDRVYTKKSPYWQSDAPKNRALNARKFLKSLPTA